MSVEIRRATPDRLPELCAVLGNAFVEEERMLPWSLGTHGDLAHRLTRQFELFNELLVEHGMIWEAVPARGAAVWIPADQGDAYQRAFEASNESVYALTDDGGKRYEEFWAWVESRIPEEPLWHLDAVGVEPASRGAGVGTALIRHGLEMARADDRGAFLETSTARNVPYYERLDFRVVEDVDAPDGGPHVWFMRWDP
jgi:ribosomal protein S18 acetylase RimI-like enzyme